MKKLICLITVLFLLLSGCAPAQSSLSVDAVEPDYWPTDSWRSSPPEAQGMDSALLADMLEGLQSSGTNIYSVLVVRNGYIVTEAYLHPYARDTKVHVQSITKSVIGMLVGRAVATGAIESADALLTGFFPGRVNANNSRAKEAIRLTHLLSMTSGLDCREFSPDGPKMEQANGWVQFMLDLPVVSQPGKKFGYCNGNAHLLSAILDMKTGMSAREYANQELFRYLGIPEAAEEDWGSDPKGYSTGGYGLRLRPVDLAKLALLELQNGQWEDKQLFSPEWVAASTTQHISKRDESGSGYGYLWTVYPKQGRYAALGLGGQQIHVYPAKNLIVVVTAGLPAYADAPEIERMLADYILPSVKSDGALAENPPAAARLQAAVEAAANPVQPVAELPAAALELSGKPYAFAENPFGWERIQFEFAPGADSARLIFNGAALEIGLDNLYRLSDTEALGQVLLRGRWEDGQTFIVDFPYSMVGPARLGELGETEMRFVFSGDHMKLTCTPLIFGGEPVILEADR